MAAPLPAPLPPSAIAPPAAPTAAPSNAPTAPSFTTSTVLSRGPVATAACSLHALTTTCSGTRGRAVTCATVREGVLTAEAAAAVSSGFDRLAITIPVTSAVAATSAMPMAVNFQGLRAICVTRSVIDLSLSAKSSIGLTRTGRGGCTGHARSESKDFRGVRETRKRSLVVAVDPTTHAVETATLGLREADAKVAGADGADDRVAVARRLHLDPRAAEVRRPVRVVGGDLDERNLLGVVERTVHPGVRHLHGLERPAGATDGLHAVERFGHAQLVPRGVVQDVERFGVAVHAPHMLVEAPVAQLDAAKDQQLALQGGERPLQ